MDLTYQQVLADVYEEHATDILVYENINVDDVDRDPYEKYDYEANELENPEEYKKFQGDRNKVEDVIKPISEGNKTDLNLETKIRTIPLNIDSAFRRNTVQFPATPTINAGQFLVGSAYSIFFVGTTNFTLIGSTNNTIGTAFIATGPGTGTGSATFVPTQSIYTQGVKGAEIPVLTVPLITNNPAPTVSSNFTTNLSQEYKNITSVKLTSMEFMNSFYTFSTLRGNTTFTITTGGVSYTFNLPSGNYSINDMITQLMLSSNYTTPLPAIGFTVTYNSNSNSFIFTCTQPYTIVFPSSTNPNNNGIGYNLGFTGTSYSSSGVTNRLVSDSSPDLVQDRYINLQINDWNLVESQGNNLTYFPVFAKIQLPVGSKNTYVLMNDYSDSSTKIYTFQQPVNIQKLQILLLDSYGNILEMRGGNFSMTIELEQVNNSAIYQKLLEL
jgi:hypothetical protein